MMNHGIIPGQLRQSVTMPLMQLSLQRRLKRQRPNMYGRHPEPAIVWSNIFGCTIQNLLGDGGHAGATPSLWPTEIAFGKCIKGKACSPTGSISICYYNDFTFLASGAVSK